MKSKALTFSNTKTFFVIIVISFTATFTLANTKLPKDIQNIDYLGLAKNIQGLSIYCSYKICGEPLLNVANMYYGTARSRSLEQLKKKRSELITATFKLNSLFETKYRVVFITAITYYIIYLYPDKTYDETLQEIHTILNNNQLSEASKYILRNNLISKPEDCPSVSILKNNNILKSFEVSNQFSGTCYAEAGLKALDYFNITYSKSTQRTSVLLSAVGVNVNRQRNFNIDYGWADQIISYVVDNKGCAFNELDKLAPSEREVFISTLNTAYREIEVSFQDMPLIPKELIESRNIDKLFPLILDYAKKTSGFSKSTNEIIMRAAGFSTESFQQMNPKNPDINLIFNYIESIGTLTNDFHESINKNGNMSFADFVLRKVFCKNDLISYPSVKFNFLQKTNSNKRLDIFKWTYDVALQISNELTKIDAQPIVTSFCSSVFYDPTLSNFYDECKDKHAVLLIGQNYNQELKQCEYELLNSWGNYSNYHSSYTVNPSEGTVWLPINQLAPNTFEMFNLIPKN